MKNAKETRLMMSEQAEAKAKARAEYNAQEPERHRKYVEQKLDEYDRLIQKIAKKEKTSFQFNWTEFEWHNDILIGLREAGYKVKIKTKTADNWTYGPADADGPGEIIPQPGTHTEWQYIISWDAISSCPSGL